MRRRRVLSFALACFIICSVISGPTFASGIFDLDEMGIDPWADMDQLPDVLPGLPDVPEAEAGEEEPEFDYVQDSNDDGIMLLADALTRYSFVSNGALLESAWGFTYEGSSYHRSHGTLGNFSGSFSDAGLATNLQTFTKSSTSYAGSLAVVGAGSSAGSAYYLDIIVPCSIPKNNTVYIGGILTGGFYFSSTYLSAGYTKVGLCGGADVLINDVIVGHSAFSSTGYNFDIEFDTDAAISNIVFRLYPMISSGIYITASPNSTVTRYFTGVAGIGASASTWYMGFWKEDSLDIQYEKTDLSIPLLGSIIEFLQTIVDGIKNIGTGIIELPGKIVTALIDGLKSLFIPSESDITSITGQYEALFSERLGFVYQAYSWVIDFASELLAALKSTDDYSFVFPGVSLPVQGVEYVFIPETAVDLDNALMSTLRPVLGTIVAFVSVAAFVNMSFSMVTALISGVSYFDFLKSGKGGGDGG